MRPNPVLKKLLNIENTNIYIYDPYFYPHINVLKHNKYDLITSTEVVEHFFDPVKEFNFLESLLNEGGLLSVRTEFHPSNLIKFKNWWYRRDLTHISFYNIKTFETISSNSNLKIVDTNTQDYIVFKKISSQ